VEIDPVSGAVTIKWKCTNPVGAGGTVYQIFRSLDAGATFEYLGGTGGKSYTDQTIPPATAQVQYKLQAVRSSSVGAWALCVVKFGAGAATVESSESDAPRLAA